MKYTRDWLASNVEFELRYARYIHPSIREGIGKFVKGVRALHSTKKFSHDLQLKNGGGPYNLSVLDLFVRNVDDLLLQQFPPCVLPEYDADVPFLDQKPSDFNIHSRFVFAGCPLPLANHFSPKTKFKSREAVSKAEYKSGDGVAKTKIQKTTDPRESIRRIAHCIFSVVEDLESALYDCPALADEEFKNICRDLETVRIIGMILSAISNLGLHSIPSTPTKLTRLIRYCDFCFRRAEVNYVHCYVHQNPKGIPEDETRHKHGKRIRKSFNPDMESLFNMVKKTGVLLALGDTPVELRPNFPPFIQDVIDLIRANEVSCLPEWWIFVDHNFPLIGSCLSTKTRGAKYWGSAVEGMWYDLDNKRETLVDPSYVISLMLAAEAWLDKDSIWVNKWLATPKPSNAEEIIRLYFDEDVPQVRIAEMLKVSRAYVSKFVKVEKIRRDSLSTNKTI